MSVTVVLAATRPLALWEGFRESREQAILTPRSLDVVRGYSTVNLVITDSARGLDYSQRLALAEAVAPCLLGGARRAGKARWRALLADFVECTEPGGSES